MFFFVEFAAFRISPSFAPCLKSKSLWQKCQQMVSFAKFAIFVEFAAFQIPPRSLAVSNLSLNREMSSNRQFCQICHFRRIRRFPDTPLFCSLSLNVVKLSLLPNSPIYSRFSKSIATFCQICHFRCCVHFWTYLLMSNYSGRSPSTI